MHALVDWDRLWDRFRTLRESRGISQDAVGAAIKKTGQTISNIERGKNKPRLANLDGMCRAIGAELLIEVVSIEDARLIQRLADLLPWVDQDGRMFIQQAIKMAELSRKMNPPAPAAELEAAKPKQKKTTPH